MHDGVVKSHSSHTASMHVLQQGYLASIVGREAKSVECMW